MGAPHVKRIWIASAATVLLLLAALPLSYQLWPAPVPVAAAVGSDIDARALYGLQDEHGQPLAEQAFAGRWLLVFFGFTRCADICPTTLVHMARVLDGLGEQAAQVQPLFISLDPERDTPQVMASYTAFFDTRIRGLTGSPEQIRQVADAYGVYAEKVPMGDTYLLDHTGSIYLVAPGGMLAELFSQQAPVDSMVQGITRAMSAPR